MITLKQGDIRITGIYEGYGLSIYKAMRDGKPKVEGIGRTIPIAIEDLKAQEVFAAQSKEQAA